MNFDPGFLPCTCMVSTINVWQTVGDHIDTHHCKARRVPEADVLWRVSGGARV